MPHPNIQNNVVIVGSGQAAGQLVSALRRHGCDIGITVIGAEPHLPYKRPPLSKNFLSGEMRIDQLLVKPAEFYKTANTHMIRNCRVLSIDPAKHTVHLDSGEALVYSHLALATGAQVRRLAVPGSDLGNIYYLRSLDDALSIRQHFYPGARLVVVGGGYIGLEVAAVGAGAGLSVTVLETADRIMSRVVGPEVSSFYERLHRSNKVDIRTNVTVEAFGGNRLVTEVVTDDKVIPADFVVIGVGIVPDVSLAADSGLTVNNGIVVDEFARTGFKDIVAAGDCTNHPNDIYGRMVRLECVQNAVDQAETAAKTICGKLEPYGSVPRFWSNQYDVRLQISGLSQDFDETVIRGDSNSSAFSVFYLRDGVVIAVDAVNSPREHIVSATLISNHTMPRTAQIQDTSVELKHLVR